MATGAVPMRDLPDGPGDCRGLAWNESPSATPDLLATFGGTAAAASPMVSSLFHPCRRPTAKELFAFCRVNSMLSASLWTGGVLRRGALYTATVQPNRKPALPCLLLGYLAKAAIDLGAPRQPNAGLSHCCAPSDDEPQQTSAHKHKVITV